MAVWFPQFGIYSLTLGFSQRTLRLPEWVFMASLSVDNHSLVWASGSDWTTLFSWPYIQIGSRPGLWLFPVLRVQQKCNLSEVQELCLNSYYILITLTILSSKSHCNNTLVPLPYCEVNRAFQPHHSKIMSFLQLSSVMVHANSPYCIYILGSGILFYSFRYFQWNC